MSARTTVPVEAPSRNRGGRFRVVMWDAADGRRACSVYRETDGPQVPQVLAHVSAPTGEIESRVRARIMYLTGRAPLSLAWFEVRSLDGTLASGRRDGDETPARIVDAEPDPQALAEHLRWLADRVEVEPPGNASLTLSHALDGTLSSTVLVQWWTPS